MVHRCEAGFSCCESFAEGAAYPGDYVVFEKVRMCPRENLLFIRYPMLGGAGKSYLLLNVHITLI